MAKIDLVTNSRNSSNRLRISIYKEPDRITVIDSLIYSSPHPQRTWTFYNLIPGDNYFYRWTEIDGSGNDIQTIASANFTVDANSIQIRDNFNLIVGLTPNVTNGAVTALLDGSNGSPDFRTWEIVPFLEGSNFMQKDVDYTWNSTTGLFTLMNGNVFVDGVRYFIQFTPRSGANNSGNVIVRDVWSTNLIITDNIVLTANDFNKNAIIMGIHSYLLITLPDISLVAPNKLLYFDSAPGFHKCAEITCSQVSGNANKIHWPTQGRRSLYMGQGETFAIYRDAAANVWRVKFADGNFKTVGEFVSEFATDVINKIPLDGGQYDAFEFGRLYNDVILKLPSTAVVPFASWTANPQKFSSADANGKFHVPFANGLYERGSGAVLNGPTYTAGQFLDEQVGPHSHQIAYSMNGTDGTPNGQHLHPGGAAPENNPTGLNPTAVQQNTGTETRPKTIVVNKYIRV